MFQECLYATHVQGSFEKYLARRDTFFCWVFIECQVVVPSSGMLFVSVPNFLAFSLLCGIPGKAGII